MAPIAITETLQDLGLQAKKNSSLYKEQSAGPKTYNKQIEEEGTADAPKAKVT
jgi:hypothetical protein